MTSFLVRSNVHPNILTLVGLAFAFLAGREFWASHYRFGAVLLLVGGIFDMLDGQVARQSDQGSRFGAFFDSTIDRYAEIVPYLGLAYSLRFDDLFLLPFLIITGSLMVSYTRARVEGLGGECSVGILERPERVVILFLGLVIGGPLLTLALWALVIGSHFTAFQRMWHARSVL